MKRIAVVLIAGAALAAPALGAPVSPEEADAIRPFQVDVPDEALTDLRRRLQATRWPDPETVSDRSQGAQLAPLQEPVRYWGSGYDWRKAEAKLNAFPQFMTWIDRVDVHFQEPWARRAFPNLIYFHEADRGGHFAMWEHPELFAEELRAAFKSLR